MSFPAGAADQHVQALKQLTADAMKLSAAGQTALDLFASEKQALIQETANLRTNVGEANVVIKQLEGELAQTKQLLEESRRELLVCQTEKRCMQVTMDRDRIHDQNSDLRTKIEIYNRDFHTMTTDAFESRKKLESCMKELESHRQGKRARTDADKPAT